MERKIERKTEKGIEEKNVNKQEVPVTITIQRIEERDKY